MKCIVESTCRFRRLQPVRPNSASCKKERIDVCMASPLFEENSINRRIFAAPAEDASRRVRIFWGELELCSSCKRIAFLSTSAAGVRSVSAMPPAAQVLIKATSFTTNYKLIASIKKKIFNLIF